MWRFALVTLIFVGSFTGLYFVEAQPTKGRQFAFLVACSDYNPSHLKPVPFTLEEMERYRKVLVETGTPETNIVFLRNKQSQARYIPTRGQILDEYKLLLNRLREEDSVVVVLTGHGIQYRGDKSAYFCPVDAKVGPDHKKTLVPMEGDDGLLTLLEKSKATRKLLIVNACRNDPASGAFLASQKLDIVDEYSEKVAKGTIAFFACDKQQKSYFYDETHARKERRKHSLFLHHLTEAWKGTYANGKKVTLEHVLHEVRERVEQESVKDFRENQTPFARGAFEGQWVLAKPVERRPAKPVERREFAIEIVTGDAKPKFANEVYVPSADEVIEKFFEIAKVTKDDVVFSPGSGDGRVLFRAADKFGCRAIGYEINKTRNDEALALSKKYPSSSHLVRIKQGDALQAKDLGEATVVFMYIFPEFMDLWYPIAKDTLKPGTRIVAHDYRWNVPGAWEPTMTVNVKGSNREHKLYMWVVPEK